MVLVRKNNLRNSYIHILKINFKNIAIKVHTVLDLKATSVISKQANNSVFAVSYTHLDVYKRQVQNMTRRDGRKNTLATVMTLLFKIGRSTSPSLAISNTQKVSKRRRRRRQYLPTTLSGFHPRPVTVYSPHLYATVYPCKMTSSTKPSLCKSITRKK